MVRKEHVLHGTYHIHVAISAVAEQLLIVVNTLSVQRFAKPKKGFPDLKCDRSEAD